MFVHTDNILLDVHTSCVMRKPDFCLCENKGANQLYSNCTADQRLCFRYTDSTISPPHIPKILSLYPASVSVQAGLFKDWSETLKTGFLASRLHYSFHLMFFKVRLSSKAEYAVKYYIKNLIRYLTELEI